MQVSSARIQAELARIEETESVRVLYAVESGSRAWGFESRDSDWDVRFIYLRRPEWYLSIARQRDVLEYPLSNALDVSGWDLPKALVLFARSNPPLYEWLRSPIVYLDDSAFTSRLRGLEALHFSRRACMNHYLHMAERQISSYLSGDSVRLKKYFYALRPLLACRWIAEHGTMPPTEFERLVAAQLPETLRPVVAALVERKRAGDEMDDEARIPALDAFLRESLADARQALEDFEASPDPGLERLNALFRETLQRVWSGS